MWLDLIKERLTERVYSVMWFVRDMRLIFHNHKMFYKVRGVSCFFCMPFPIFPNFRDSRTLQELQQSCPEERSKRVGLQKKTASQFQQWRGDVQENSKQDRENPRKQHLKKSSIFHSRTDRIVPLRTIHFILPSRSNGEER